MGVVCTLMMNFQVTKINAHAHSTWKYVITKTTGKAATKPNHN